MREKLWRTGTLISLWHKVPSFSFFFSSSVFFSSLRSPLYSIVTQPPGNSIVLIPYRVQSQLRDLPSSKLKRSSPAHHSHAHFSNLLGIEAGGHGQGSAPPVLSLEGIYNRLFLSHILITILNLIASFARGWLGLQGCCGSS